MMRYSTASFVVIASFMTSVNTSIAFYARPAHTGSPSVGTLRYRSDPDIVDISPDAIVNLDVVDGGTADNSPKEYWFDSRIHTLGNTGFMGAFHAAIAPLSTIMIDKIAYDGVNVREMVANRLYNEIGKSQARVVDFACGVGISTRALLKAFPDAEAVIGLDTSREMIAMARAVSSHVKIMQDFLAGFMHMTHYLRLSHHFDVLTEIASAAYSKATGTVEAAFVNANAESTAMPNDSFDLATIMYCFHEAPADGRNRILREAHRVLKDGGTLAVVDISSDYEPNESMLAGEPYALEYLKNINKQISKAEGFRNVIHDVIVPGHVSMWRLTCDKESQPSPAFS
mmetsp:Transcript_27660/g.61510  ORF Transcript_27660/g.61510 Transcript_27660/m.61510 type:complete len:342 (+) Transcript_27660:607-1632(+)